MSKVIEFNVGDDDVARENLEQLFTAVHVPFDKDEIKKFDEFKKRVGEIEHMQQAWKLRLGNTIIYSFVEWNEDGSVIYRISEQLDDVLAI